MSSRFIVTINNQTVYTWNEPRTPARMRRYLDEMDADMEQGIQLGENRVSSPSDYQKQQYVAMMLLRALDQKKPNLADVMAAYLSNRCETLKEIRANVDAQSIDFELIM